jgi:glycosyltransferase involved in cell wall biosynthesis
VATEPLISVVVATRDRRDRLPRLLAALETQRDAPPFEAVVVDDGSIDGTYDELKRLGAEMGLPLTPMRLETSQGPATARSAGWRRARGPLIAFTDDDCAPQPGWLAAFARALEDADVVQGRTLPDPDQLVHRNVFSHTIVNENERGFYETCNMGYRRSVLEELGGFDEGFRWPYGEDTDLAWRAKRAGASVVFETAALVHHDVRRQTYVAHLRDLRRREGVVRAVKRNPEMRQLCHYGVFWHRGHPAALWAAVGLATAASARGRPSQLLAGLAMCAPYARYRTVVHPVGLPSKRPVTIPLVFLSDVADIAVLAMASVRYRTLVL